MTINEFGSSVASVWEGLRPVTRNMLERAMRSGNKPSQSGKTAKFIYDAHADWEVSRLLTALDEQSRSSEVRRDNEKLAEIRQLADTCVRVLEDQSASAEVFILLAQRAIRENNFHRLDKLADHLAERYSAAEIAEIVRQTDLPQVRAIAYETLAMLPVQALMPLLDDHLYSGIAGAALEQKAYEFESDEARDLLDQLDGTGEMTGQ